MTGFEFQEKLKVWRACRKVEGICSAPDDVRARAAEHCREIEASLRDLSLAEFHPVIEWHGALPVDDEARHDFFVILRAAMRQEIP